MYLALKKKSALVLFFKAAKELKIAEFISKSFDDERSKTAASKNAYALLGKQRFEYAAAFFLLAGSY